MFLSFYSTEKKFMPGTKNMSNLNFEKSNFILKSVIYIKCADSSKDKLSLREFYVTAVNKYEEKTI